MQQEQKETFSSNNLNYDFFIRKNQSKDLNMSIQQQKIAISGILVWLNNYQNIKELSHIGKNPIVRYNFESKQYNTLSSVKTVRLDCQGKSPYCRYYIQQDKVKGKTNLGQIYILQKLDKLMQANQNEEDRKQSQKWRGRVQNILVQFRKYTDQKIKIERDVSVCVRIQVIE